MTTTNQPTPATATKLHAMLDDLLTPPRATPPETSTTALSATSLVEDLKEIARRSQPRLRRAPAPQPEPVALHEAVRVVPHAKSELVDLHEVVRVVPHAKSELVDLHEAYEWDPMPTSGDPWGLRERMETLETAIAARTAQLDPHPAPATPTMSPLTEARLNEAHRRIDEILG